MSRGLSVSPLSAQVFPYRQLVSGGKVLDSFKVHKVCFSGVRKFQGAIILFKRPDVFANLGVGSPFKKIPVCARGLDFIKSGGKIR